MNNLKFLSSKPLSSVAVTQGGTQISQIKRNRLKICIDSIETEADFFFLIGNTNFISIGRTQKHGLRRQFFKYVQILWE